MNEQDSILGELIGLSRELGREQRGLVILGEGNISADRADGTFWIKASGSQLGKIDAGGFSRVRFAFVQELLAGGPLSDTQVAEGLRRALADGSHRQPSVETFLHTVCLTEGGARWVAHLHPIAVNQFLCSQLGAEPFLRHIYPDAVVLCGKVPAVIPYTDPGYALAEAARETLKRYRELHGTPPKLLLMVNHGLVALGQTAQEVFNIALMADKWARVLLGAYALGGPRYMPESEVDRIDSRLDEHYRRNRLSE